MKSDWKIASGQNAEGKVEYKIYRSIDAEENIEHYSKTFERYKEAEETMEFLNAREECMGASEEEYECTRPSKPKDFGEIYMDKCQKILLENDNDE